MTELSFLNCFLKSVCFNFLIQIYPESSNLSKKLFPVFLTMIDFVAIKYIDSDSICCYFSVFHPQKMRSLMFNNSIRKSEEMNKNPECYSLIRVILISYFSNLCYFITLGFGTARVVLSIKIIPSKSLFIVTGA